MPDLRDKGLYFIHNSTNYDATDNVSQDRVKDTKGGVFIAYIVNLKYINIFIIGNYAFPRFEGSVFFKRINLGFGNELRMIMIKKHILLKDYELKNI